MTEPTSNKAAESELGAFTVPDSFTVCARGFDTEERGRTFGELVDACVRVLSRRFDLSHLDGVTIAYDYAQALLDLDRGYATSFKLTPTEGHSVGIAMTPSVMRDGVLKSHIVLNARSVTGLEDDDLVNFGLAMHTLAHECAHVEITHKFDIAFPNFLLRRRADARIGYRWQIILACWDEYAATRLSAGIGIDLPDGYEETLLTHLAEARESANESIKAYRIHADIDQVLAEVHVAYGDLLKYAAYLLGNLDGHGIAVSDRPRITEALAHHWFEPFFTQLHLACKAITESYGRWEDQASFEVIGDLAEELVAFGGVYFPYRPDGQRYVDIPLTLDTIPDVYPPSLG